MTTVTSYLTFCLLILVSLVVIISSAGTSKKDIDLSFVDAEIMATRYSNTWACEIKEGTLESVEELLQQLGLIIAEKEIGGLHNFYKLELPGDSYSKERKDITQALESSNLFEYVEQQEYSHHVPKKN